MARNRILAVITLLGATAATVIVAGSARSYSSAPTAKPHSVTVTRYDRTGAEGTCSDNRCEIEFTRGPTLGIPAGGSSDTAIITVSLQYNTTGPGHFGYRASLWRPNGHPFGHVQPRDRRLARAVSPESTTLIWRVSHLVPGGRYTVRYGPDIRPTSAATHISTHHVLVVVTARPDAQS